MWNTLSISLLIVVIVLAVLFLGLIIYHLNIMNTIKDMDKRIKIVNHEETNTLVSSSTTNKTIVNFAKSINENLKYTNDLRYKITKEEQKLVSTITNLSHDLRTPITSLLGYTQLLEHEGLTNEQTKYVDVIKSRIEIIKEIVDELYEYSLAYEDRELHFEFSDVTSILETTILSFYTDFEAKGFEVKIDLENCKIEALVDPFELKRVFINIIGNALKYGNSLFMVECHDREFRFTNRISNVDLIDVEQIFDRFFTVAKARTNGSTGLGLSISKKLIEKMNGTLSAVLNDDLITIILKL